MSRTDTQPAAAARPPAGDEPAATALTDAPVGLCVVDRALRIVSANAEMAALLEGAEPLAGRRLAEVAPVIGSQLAAPLEAAFAGRAVSGMRLHGDRGTWIVSARQVAGRRKTTAQVSLALQRLAPGPAPDEHAHALLAAIVQSSTDAIISKTLDGVITFWNAAAERLFGYSAQEAVGRHITMLIPDDRHEEERVIRERLRRGEVVEHFETQRRTRDGRLLDVSVTISPVRDDTGRIIGASNTTRDITEQKRARQALRESEKRFRALADAAPVLIWMSGRSKEGVYFSRPWLEFTGLPLEAQLGAGWLRCVHPDDAERLNAVCSQAFEKREAFTIDFRLRRADGEFRWMRENAVPRLSPGGELLGYIGACVDVTETRHAAEELERSRRALKERADELQTLLDVLPIGVFIAQDPEGRSITANAAGQRMLRLPAPDSNASKTAETADQLPFRVLKDGREVAAEDLPIQRSCRDGAPINGEAYDVVFDDGTVSRLYEFVAPLRRADGSVRGAVGAFVDITEQQRSQDTLRRRARQQAAVARLGQMALTEPDLDRLLDQAVAMVAETLEVELCKTLELLPGGEELLLRSGVGWRKGLVRRGRVGAGLDSQAGFTLVSAEPVVVEDLRQETRFSGPPLLHEHGVISGISCVIHAGSPPGSADDEHAEARPWGVLGAHCRTKRTFTRDDVNFLQAMANVLGSAIRQRRAEQALRESQSHLSLAMIAGRMGAWEFDLASGHVHWSSTLEQIHGIPLGSFGGTFQDFQSDIHPEDRQRVLQTVQRVIARREPYHVEYRINRPDGALVWLEARGHVIVDEHGQAERLVGVCADVTDRKQADRALRESEERFRTLANSAPVLIWVNDVDGAVFVNQSYLDFLGVDEQQVTGFGWTEAVHPDDRSSYMKAYQKAFERRIPFEATFRFRRHDGQYRWMKVVGIPRLSGERLAGYVGSMIDITDVFEAEQALRQSFDQLRVIYSLSDAVARADSLDEINRLAVDGVIDALDVDRASLLLFDEAGVMRFCAWRGVSDGYRAAVEGHSPWTPDAVDPVPITIPDVAADRGLGDLRQRIVDEGISALAFIPLVSAGRLLGKLMLYSDRPRRFTTEELRLAQTIAGHVAFAIDRGQAAEALRESEARFRTLADNIAQLAWMADASGMVFWYNQRWFDYTGTALEQMQGEGWTAVHHPQHVDRVLQKFRRDISAGRIWEDTFPLRGADGAYRWFLSRAVPIRDAEGRVIRWFGTNTDITDTREAHEERLKYVALVENSLDFIGMAAPDGRILYFNPAARRLLGVEPDADIAAMRVDDVIPPELQAMYREEAIPQTLEKGFWEGEVRFRRRSGEEVPVYQTMFLIRYPAEGGEVCLATVAQNITARKRHEQQMSLVMGELNHRVKNTLAVVESIARQTLRSSAQPDEFIASFGERLRGLARVHGMLTQTHWEGVPLDDLVRAELAPRIADGEQAAIEGPPVTLNPGAALTVHMTLHELATNAAKHGALSVPGGAVRVRWICRGEGADRALHIEWLERGGPPVATPTCTGFGTRVLNQLIGYELRGRCEVSYEPEGLRCNIRIPGAAVCEGAA